MNPRFPQWPPPPGSGPMPPPHHGRAPGPPMGPPPPRRKPGEKDENEQPRKGRCLIRETKAYGEKKSIDHPGIPEKTPTRNFVDQPNNPNNLVDTRLNQGIFLAALSALGLIVIIAISVAVLWVMQPGGLANPLTEEKSTNDAEAAAEATVQAAPLRDGYRELKSAALKRIEDSPKTVEEVLLLNDQATGYGLARTASMEGTTTSNNRQYDINVFTKAPNQMRQVLSMADLKITTIYNGSQGSLHLQNFATKRNNHRATTPEQNLIAAMSTLICMPLWQYGVAPGTMEDLGLETVDSVVYRVLANHAFPQHTIKHYFEQDTMVERLRTTEYTSDGQPCRVQVKFLDYQRDGNFYTPMRIEIIENSSIEIRTVSEIKQWIFNQGLLPNLFVVDNNN